MSVVDQETRSKNFSRITDARLAVKQADTYLRRYPASSATETVRNCKLALSGLLAALESP